MNKILKRISLMAVGFLFIGTGLTVGGVLLGGNLLFSYTPGQPISNMHTTGYDMVTEEIEPVHSILVDTNYFDVKITSGQAFSITYPVGKHLTSDYTIENDTLMLTVQEKCKFSVNLVDFKHLADDNLTNSSDNTIVLTIPQDTTLTYITIEDSDGDCIVENQDSDNYTFDLSYGDLTLTNCTGGKVTIQSGDGDSAMTACSFQTLTENLSYGSGSITDSTIDTSDLKLSDGDLTLKNGSLSTIKAELSYGDLSSDNVTISQLSAFLSDGDFHAVFDETEDTFSTDLRASDGDITINGTRQDEFYNTSKASDKTLSVTTSYGDIDIHFSK